VRANSLPSSSCWHYTFAKYASQNARTLLAAQTTGGALGNMLAPAQVIVGCSTTGIKARDGDVLRVTVPYGLVIESAIRVLTLVWTIK
jgi:lactate permease